MTIRQKVPEVFKTEVNVSSLKKALQIQIETPRLVIRSYRDEDYDNCRALYGNPQITKYFDQGKPRSEQEISDLISEKGNRYFKTGQPFGLFSIFLKDSMTFIGQIDLLPSDEPGIVEIGFILSSKYQNKGFCTEAAKAFLYDYIPELTHQGYSSKGSLIRGVMATVHPDNSPSRQVIEKIGMRFEKFQSRFGLPRLWYSLGYPRTKR
jgi:ribosomal-protein-alanine N-acetyltransferase